MGVTNADKCGQMRTFLGDFDEKCLFRKKNRPFLHFFNGVFKKCKSIPGESKLKIKAPDEERTYGKWKENNEAISHTIRALLAHLSCTFRATSTRKVFKSLAKCLPKVEIIE